MKNLLLILSLSFSLSSFGGGFLWPNVDYAYAKLYYFNIYLEKPSDFDYYIYHDSVFAASKLGEGITLSDDLLSKVHDKIARYSDPMRMGLSKCYFPRHGIIYFNEVGKAVASLSICFECDKISLWSANPLREVRPNSKHDWSHVEKVFAKMKSEFEDEKIIVYDKESTYQEKFQSDSNLMMMGEMFMTNNDLDAKYLKKYSIDEVRRWNKNEHFDLKLTEKSKYTAGGEKWTYKQLDSPTAKSRFIFYFDEENPYLIEATIEDNGIELPNGVSVGMSLEDVMATFKVYDGIANPAHIQVKDEHIQLDYYFEKFTLIKVKLSISST